MEKVVTKMKQGRVIALYRCSHWGKLVVEEYRKGVLDNYGLLINLVKKMESPFSTRREKLLCSRKANQIAGYMKRTLTTETPERRSSHQKRVQFGEISQYDEKNHYQEYEIDKENIGSDFRIMKLDDQQDLPPSNKL